MSRCLRFLFSALYSLAAASVDTPIPSPMKSMTFFALLVLVLEATRIASFNSSSDIAIQSVSSHIPALPEYNDDCCSDGLLSHSLSWWYGSTLAAQRTLSQRVAVCYKLSTGPREIKPRLQKSIVTRGCCHVARHHRPRLEISKRAGGHTNYQ